MSISSDSQCLWW